MSGYVFVAVAIVCFILCGVGLNWVFKAQDKIRDEENMYYEG